MTLKVVSCKCFVTITDGRDVWIIVYTSDGELNHFQTFRNMLYLDTYYEAFMKLTLKFIKKIRGSFFFFSLGKETSSARPKNNESKKVSPQV